MASGNINEFIKTRRDAYLLVGLSSLSTALIADIPFSQLKAVARGYIYMQSGDDTWGSKGGNGHARLADSGFLTIASDPIHPTASSSSAKGGTTRWMSPELLGPDQFGFNDSRLTKESDCYALGMVIYEVRSGQVPHRSIILLPCGRPPRVIAWRDRRGERSMIHGKYMGDAEPVLDDKTNKSA